MKAPWRNLAIGLFVVSIFFGNFFGEQVLAVNDETRELMRVYTELLSLQHESYGDEVSYENLVYSSISGMLQTLDPHTNFLTPETYSSMREKQQSTFYGLGILVSIRNNQLTVITPIEGTPASRMGLRAGDVISSIEGESTEAMSLDEAVQRLKGPKGTEVSITIARGGLDEPLKLTITRDEIPQNPVRYTFMLDDRTGYISLNDFNRGTGHEIQNAIEKLRGEGMEQLLLDLRANGGGLLDESIEVADQFIPDEGGIVETRGRTRDSFQSYAATDAYRDLGIPLVVLVGTSTASAAEILAGAIQDHDVGLIVGTPTWGKGLVQTVYSLSYGSGLALTTARYYTPSGRLIQRDYSSWFDYRSNDREEPIVATSDDPALTFQTDLGRVVYGGGGITPDILVKPEEPPTIVQRLLSRNAFFNFSVRYTSEHEELEREWSPSDRDLADFRDWLVGEELSEAAEIDEAMAEPATRDFLARTLRAEIFNSKFGLDERYRVLAEGDSQIRRALELFPDARALLAERSALMASGPQVEKPAKLN